MAEKANTLQQILLDHVGVNFETATLVGVWLAAFSIAKLLLAGGRKHDEGRNTLAATAGWFRRLLEDYYVAGVAGFLRVSDRLAGDHYLKTPEPKRLRDLDPRGESGPWSNGLYDLCLRLALAYPLVFLFLGWGFSGEIMAGLAGFLPNVPEGWHRAVAISAMALVFRL